ncbi:DUF2975 domain-containing protein [Mucilaginibacter sp. RS28]|uniref:DUF2975 domain-containing protein n=1 Tax=Mucilaginibacter straminoryzae TaxID=2932774 RepID=A0A9X2BCE4_9SPHI|nr:DUF2975 domain-containing protein [Mucilaginibacter straminoryzae]MCJ8210842.1 DUF2975 domain-containing protein [Mucilaginibacter straminoryzae]
MKKTFNTDLIVNALILFAVLAYIVLGVLPLILIKKSDPFSGWAESNCYQVSGHKNSYAVSDTLPYYQYKKKLEEQKNKRYYTINGIQSGLSPVSRISFSKSQYLDARSMMQWNHTKLGIHRYFIDLNGWILNRYIDEYKTDSISFEVKSGKPYLYKPLISKLKDNSGCQLLTYTEEPVKYWQLERHAGISIPVSESFFNVARWIIMPVSFGLIVYFLYLIALFLKFIVDVSRGASFTNVNLRRLLIIAVSLLVYPFLRFFTDGLAWIIFHTYFNSDIRMAGFDWGNASRWVGAGLVFLLLFKAFRQAKKLQEEHDLTI